MRAERGIEGREGEAASQIDTKFPSSSTSGGHTKRPEEERDGRPCCCPLRGADTGRRRGAAAPGARRHTETHRVTYRDIERHRERGQRALGG